MILRRVEWAPGYFVDDDGNVVSTRRGPTRNLRPGIVGGYQQVVLMVDGERRQVKVHSLVCEAFNGPRPAGQQCRHLDGNPLNNSPANLAWGTALDNAADRKAHRGNYFRVKHDEDAVRDARESWRRETQQATADRLGVSRSWVSAVQNGRIRTA